MEKEFIVKVAITHIETNINCGYVNFRVKSSRDFRAKRQALYMCERAMREDWKKTICHDYNITRESLDRMIEDRLISYPCDYAYTAVRVDEILAEVEINK